MSEFEEIPRGLVADSSAPLPVVQHEDGSTEPAPAGSVLAEDIIGQLTNEQIAEIEAAKISGKLTAEQIENIHAAQIIGELVNAQIQSIAAGKITGELEAAQIKNLPTGKLTGFITNAQIEEIAAVKITGTITETQIGNESITTPKIKALAVTTNKLAAASVVAEKIAAEAVEANAIKALTITAAKIAAGAIIAEKIGAEAVEATKIKALAVTSGKIAAEAIITEKLAASAVTTGKLAAEAITAEKISAGAITTAKLAAGAVVAEKLNVSELSAISANLGTVTAGTLKAVKIEGGTGSFEGELKATSLTMPSGGGVTPATKDIIRWLDAETSAVNAFVYGNKNFSEKQLVLGPRDSGTTGVRLVLMDQRPENTRMQASLQTLKSSLILEDASASGGEVSFIAQVNTVTRTILSSSGTSAFLQLQGEGNRKINIGTFTLTWAASTNSNAPEVTHGLSVEPLVVMCAPRTSPSFGNIPVFNIVSRGATKFTVNAETKSAFSGSIVCMFLAIG